MKSKNGDGDLGSSGGDRGTPATRPNPFAKIKTKMRRGKNGRYLGKAGALGGRRGRKDNIAVTAVQRSFLHAWLAVGSKMLARKVMGLCNQTPLNWKKGSDAFAAACKEVEEMIADNLEDELHQRALHGIKKAIVFQGKVTGHLQEKDAATLIFALKGAKPDKYRENMVQLVAGAPTAIQINLGDVKRPEPNAPVNED